MGGKVMKKAGYITYSGFHLVYKTYKGFGLFNLLEF